MFANLLAHCFYLILRFCWTCIESVYSLALFSWPLPSRFHWLPDWFWLLLDSLCPIWRLSLSCRRQLTFNRQLIHLLQFLLQNALSGVLTQIEQWELVEFVERWLVRTVNVDQNAPWMSIISMIARALKCISGNQKAIAHVTLSGPSRSLSLQCWLLPAAVAVANKRLTEIDRNLFNNYSINR